MNLCDAEEGEGYECTLRGDHDGPHEAWGLGASASRVWGTHASELPVDLRLVGRPSASPKHAAGVPA